MPRNVARRRGARPSTRAPAPRTVAATRGGGVSIISRGFHGRRRQPGAGLIPPGQYLVDDFPVLTAGPTPHTPLEQWDFTILDDSNKHTRKTKNKHHALPAESPTVDIH